MKLGVGACALGVWVAALGQLPLISSFSQNGELVCTNLEPGSVATVEWASSVTGPWTNNWAGLDSVVVDSNGMIRVSVPMFYRVRGGPVPTTNMALIPAGSFTMGDSLEGYTVHTNYVSAFYMDKYEVTRALWDAVYQWATNHGYSFDNAGSGKAANHPVQRIEWYDAVKWCNARSEKEGRTPAYYTDSAQTAVYRSGTNDLQESFAKWNAGYRLPTEAEWEKAARGGASGHRFPWTDTDTITQSRANYSSSWSGGVPFFPYDVNPTSGYHPTFDDGVYPYTSPVGYFAANGYELYDMAGNVWEWCWDWIGEYSSGSQIDPRGPTSGSARVNRGGGWYDTASNCQTVGRSGDNPDYRDYAYGFRSVLPLGQP